MLTHYTDFFGNVIEQTAVDQESNKVDKALQKLREPPKNEALFQTMMKACLQAAIEVLERQYRLRHYREIKI